MFALGDDYLDTCPSLIAGLASGFTILGSRPSGIGFTEARSLLLESKLTQSPS